MLNIGFGGIGCPHPGIECLIAQLNKMMLHYGCASSLGIELQTSMELFVLEFRLLFTMPFLHSFAKYESLVTHCWLKTLWEKCNRYKIDIQVCNINLHPPREGDR